MEGGLLLTEVTACGRCGTRSWAGTKYCYACGQSLTPNGQAVVSPGQPPTPFATVPPAVPAVPPYAPTLAPAGWPVSGGAPDPGGFNPSGGPSAPPWYGAAGPYGTPPAGYNAGSPSGTGVARPTGITILAIVEIAIGVGGLSVALDLIKWANVSNYYQAGEGAFDLVMALAYLTTSVAVFGLARGLWSMQPWAWMRACLLSIVLLGLIVLAVFEWGVETTDVVGVTVYLSVLAYLNTNSVRGLFGRPPTTFLQGSR